jgi:superoxide reductase
MTQKSQIYKCNICGNIVEVLHTGAGELVCCNQPMQVQEEKDHDEGEEKHAPIIKKEEDGTKITVGSILHPMQEDHFIEWIELTIDDKIFKKFLSSKDKPEIKVSLKGGKIKARAFCNLHGLWKA